jgi:hypothetical protein
MQARLKKNSNCGCTLAEAFFIIALWSYYADQVKRRA